MRVYHDAAGRWGVGGGDFGVWAVRGRRQSPSDAPTQHLEAAQRPPTFHGACRAEGAAPGFTNGEAAWFNVAAADPSSSSSCGPSLQVEKQRAERWFAVACHLLAHAVAGEEQGMVERAEIQVWRLYLDPFKAAFNL